MWKIGTLSLILAIYCTPFRAAASEKSCEVWLADYSVKSGETFRSFDRVSSELDPQTRAILLMSLPLDHYRGTLKTLRELYLTPKASLKIPEEQIEIYGGDLYAVVSGSVEDLADLDRSTSQHFQTPTYVNLRRLAESRLFYLPFPRRTLELTEKSVAVLLESEKGELRKEPLFLWDETSNSILLAFDFSLLDGVSGTILSDLGIEKRTILTADRLSEEMRNSAHDPVLLTWRGFNLLTLSAFKRLRNVAGQRVERMGAVPPPEKLRALLRECDGEACSLSLSDEEQLLPGIEPDEQRLFRSLNTGYLERTVSILDRLGKKAVSGDSGMTAVIQDALAPLIPLPEQRERFRQQVEALHIAASDGHHLRVFINHPKGQILLLARFTELIKCFVQALEPSAMGQPLTAENLEKTLQRLEPETAPPLTVEQIRDHLKSVLPDASLSGPGQLKAAVAKILSRMRNVADRRAALARLKAVQLLDYDMGNSRKVSAAADRIRAAWDIVRSTGLVAGVETAEPNVPNRQIGDQAGIERSEFTHEVILSMFQFLRKNMRNGGIVAPGGVRRAFLETVRGLKVNGAALQEFRQGLDKVQFIATEYQSLIREKPSLSARQRLSTAWRLLQKLLGDPEINSPLSIESSQRLERLYNELRGRPSPAPDLAEPSAVPPPSPLQEPPLEPITNLRGYGREALFAIRKVLPEEQMEAMRSSWSGIVLRERINSESKPLLWTLLSYSREETARGRYIVDYVYPLRIDETGLIVDVLSDSRHDERAFFALAARQLNIAPLVAHLQFPSLMGEKFDSDVELSPGVTLKLRLKYGLEPDQIHQLLNSYSVVRDETYEVRTLELGNATRKRFFLVLAPSTPMKLINLYSKID